MRPQQEIKDLREQIQHLEDALESLSKPGQKAPVENSLAATLQARFEQLDSDVEREKSLRVTKTLLQEVRSKLQAKEEEFKQLQYRVSEGLSAMRRKADSINILSKQIEENLVSLEAIGERFLLDWQKINDSSRRPLSKNVEVLLPLIKAGF